MASSSKRPRARLSLVLGLSALLLGLTSCGAENDADSQESQVIGRTTSEICNAVDPRWGDRWEAPDTTGSKRGNVTDAFACANRLYWSTRFHRLAVHHKFYLHKKICTTNPASHYAMEEEQAEFYCSLSLHFRMCNTQGLYALRPIPDSETRRERERAIFSECLEASGELAHFRTALRLGSASDADVKEVVERLYDEYKVQAGVRVSPPVVNPDRARLALLEELIRISFYGVTVPLELLETAFSDAFLSLDSAERESELKLIADYRRSLMEAEGGNLLDVDALPICANGQLEPGEQCDDGNTVSADGCSAICTNP